MRSPAQQAQQAGAAEAAAAGTESIGGIAAKLGLDFGFGSQATDSALPPAGAGTQAAAPGTESISGIAEKLGLDFGLGSQTTDSALSHAGSGGRVAAEQHASSSGPGGGSSSGGVPAPAASFTAETSCGIVRWTDLQLQGSAAGAGSFGTVLLATLEETPVAAKVLVPLRQGPSGIEAAGSLTERQLAKVQRECSLLASVRHPNIVQILSVCEDPPTIIMEYCSKGSLLDVLQEARKSPRQAALLSWQRRLGMALDAARGILHMHNRGIAHRDLKSPNLLVDAGMRVKVADFGFCKALDGGGDNVMSTTLDNVNPKWQAPEVLFGQPATTASDAYAMGVCLWELMTWSIPWSGVVPARIIGLKMNGMHLELPSTPESLAQLPGTDKDRAAFPRVAPQYIRVIQQCWAASEADRPAFATIIQQLTEIQKALSAAA
ncbi:Serine threonine- kinase CTR1 [Chlorella sorokiniana]|uniref:Serine threonine-kinase CTR1 n=1 Tax=Chlorella sorokiniana TaxID=3076 RepID=A0A2P6TNA8_CHLSO|nr:Serine threonine- kinase CTR1 [Chlorella sorokiniana]|eukprot:PRW50803.1 Serine threonine- kinase CTR1 [Chlorella sorokiniana]